MQSEVALLVGQSVIPLREEPGTALRFEAACLFLDARRSYSLKGLRRSFKYFNNAERPVRQRLRTFRNGTLEAEAMRFLRAINGNDGARPRTSNPRGVVCQLGGHWLSC